jgi:O-antigen ligase
MATLIVSLIALGTLAFGAVYPWAYIPLLGAAALIGLIGLLQHGVVLALRPVAAGLLAITAAVTIQLIPLPPDFVQAISPSTVNLLSRYDLAFVNDGGWHRLSIDPARTRMALFALVALGLYVVGLPGLLDGRRLRLLPAALAFVAVPLALFAIYTRQHNNGLIYGFWQPLEGGGADQAGPFINRNHFGGWIVMSLSLMIGWLLGRVERALPSTGAVRRRKPIVVDDDMGAVLLMGTAIVLGTISVFWVMSRSAITSLGLAMVLFMSLVLKRRSMGNTLRAFVLLSLGLILVAGISWRGIDVLARWFLDERSLLSRIGAWRDGWDVVGSFPVFGTGLNTYSPAMLIYQLRNPQFHMAQAHNDYLQLLAEGGVVVAAAAAVTVMLLMIAVRRTLRAARVEVRGYWVRAGAAVGLIAIAFQELVEFSLQIPANALLFCTLATITLTPVHRRTPAGAELRDNIDVRKDTIGVVLS